jgi:hypothetical protein
VGGFTGHEEALFAIMSWKRKYMYNTGRCCDHYVCIFGDLGTFSAKMAFFLRTNAYCTFNSGTYFEYNRHFRANFVLK